MINYIYIGYRAFIVDIKKGIFGVTDMKKIKQFLSKKTVAITLLILATIALTIAAYFIFRSDTDKEIVYKDYVIAEGHQGKIEDYDPSYTVEGYKGDKYRAYYIRGKITALEDKSFTVITFNLYDKKDNLLGTAVAGLNEVKKGKTYSFKALSLVENKDIDKIDHYEIKDVKLG